MGLSRYKEEDERLFFGGFRRIKIESIRKRATKQNFKQFIYSLCYLDCMLTGGAFNGSGLKINNNDITIIQNLMNDFLGKPTTKTFDDYIYSTFKCFSQHKKQIVLDLFQLYHYADKKMTDLIMYPLDEVYLHKGDKE